MKNVIALEPKVTQLRDDIYFMRYIHIDDVPNAKAEFISGDDTPTQESPKISEARIFKYGPLFGESQVVEFVVLDPKIEEIIMNLKHGIGRLNFYDTGPYRSIDYLEYKIRDLEMENEHLRNMTLWEFIKMKFMEIW